MKSRNSTGPNPNVDLQSDESKDDKGIGPLVANVVGIVEERVARPTRDQKGAGLPCSLISETY